MFDFLKKLFGWEETKPVVVEAKATPKTSVEAKPASKNEEEFVDPDTGKSYKTAGALKAAQTRRMNKLKAKKTAKKTNRKSKK